MNILIVGANGQVAKQLVHKIKDEGKHNPIAMVRREDQIEQFNSIGVETRLIDLMDNQQTIEDGLNNIDSIVFSAGSGGHTGADQTMFIDLDGAVKVIEAAKSKNINRFIMVSSFDTTRQAIEEAPESFRPYVIAKHYADVWLRGSGLDYTIVHPGKLEDTPSTGKVKLAEQVELGSISREAVADVLLQVIYNESTIGKEFQIIDGDEDIVEAVQNY